ncbi:hypothetical protein BDZ89DRAFT_1143399 [Hymenopellis radicata]|nr:hypothetical protein BDZ89DRAFT_1143399 [Hymenopellis radicata]
MDNQPCHHDYNTSQILPGDSTPSNTVPRPSHTSCVLLYPLHSPQSLFDTASTTSAGGRMTPSPTPTFGVTSPENSPYETPSHFRYTPAECRWPYVAQIDARMVWIEDRLQDALLIVRVKRSPDDLRKALASLIIELIHPVMADRPLPSTNDINGGSFLQILPRDEYWGTIASIDHRMASIEDRLHDALLLIRLRRDPELLRCSLASLLLELLQPSRKFRSFS